MKIPISIPSTVTQPTRPSSVSLDADLHREVVGGRRSAQVWLLKTSGSCRAPSQHRPRSFSSPRGSVWQTGQWGSSDTFPLFCLSNVSIFILHSCIHYFEHVRRMGPRSKSANCEGKWKGRSWVSDLLPIFSRRISKHPKLGYNMTFLEMSAAA